MQSLKRWHELAKAIESQIRGPRFFHHMKLKGTNLYKVYDAQLLWMGIVVDLKIKNGISVRKQSLARATRVLASTDVYEWLTELDAAHDWLIASCEDQSELLEFWKSPARTNTSITLLLDFLRPLIDNWVFRSDIQAFRDLLQVYSFPKRLSLDIPELEQAAYEKWIECEKHMAETSEFVPESCFNPLRDVLAEWFPETDGKFVWKHFMPHHGTGSIASWEKDVPHNIWQYKTDNMQFLPKTLAFLRRIGFLCEEYGLMQRPYNGLRPAVKCESFRDHDTAKVIFVNKSWKTYRTISAEPIGNMWVQQGVGEVLNWYLGETSLSEMSDYYSINSEGRNRFLAVKGSESGDYATIDFSSASDCNNYRLVRHAFSRTWLSEAIEACRTTYAETPDGSVYAIDKFAQMGSRMCFPIMTIIIAGLARVAIDEVEGTTNCALTKRFGLPPFVVYGDDLVIRTKYVDAFINWAETFGFRINVSKSFTSKSARHLYRESCGVEAIDGHIVTPIYLSRHFPGLPHGQFLEGEDGDRTISSEHCRTLASSIQLANVLVEYPLTHSIIVRKCREAAGDVLLFTSDGTGLYTNDTHPNHHLSVKYDEDLQAPYVEAFVLRPDTRLYWDYRDAYILPAAALYEELRLGYKRMLSDELKERHKDLLPDPSDRLICEPRTYVEDVVGSVGRHYWPDL